MSRYTVDMENLRRFTELSLQPSEECDIILIDEIGKMELYSREFEESVENILGSDKAVLAVLHRNYLDRYREHGEIFRLDENYDDIKEKVKSRMAMQID